MITPQVISRRRFLKESAAAGAIVGLAPSLLAAEDPTRPHGKLKVGLIGCGSVSGAYLPNLTSKDYIEVVSVCDIRPERARKRAEEFKVPNA